MLKKDISKILQAYVYIALGAFIMGFGLHFFLFPNKIASGGVTGLALIVNSVFNISSGLFVTISNIFLFTIAFIIISGEFGFRSIYAASFLSISLYFYEYFFPHVVFTKELNLATIFGSFFMSIGGAIIYLHEASTGGTSIIGKIINKYFNIGLGMAAVIADIFVAILAVFAFNIDLALYGLLSVYFTGFLIDKFIDGFNSKKQIMIITNKKEIVLDYILKDFDRGCTILKGVGAFSKNEKDILITVLDRKQFVLLRTFLKKQDPTAFITVTDVIKVFGEGFDNLS